MEKYNVTFKNQVESVEAATLIIQDEPIAVIYKSAIGYVSVNIDERKGKPFTILKDRANNAWIVPLDEKAIYTQRLEHLEEIITTDGHYHVG